MKKTILNSKNFYQTYFLDETPRPTIFIVPGGGYKYTSPRESEPVAKAFLKHGFHAVILNYRETTETYPMPGIYLGEALKEIRKDERVSKVIGLGFSAGGHCLLEYCLHRKEYSLEDRPDLLILGYPVITSDPACAHQGSFEVLLGDRKEDENLRKHLSLETQVTKDNAIDLFLWGTYTDSSVPVENSIRLIEAYHKVGGNAEYHMFYFGGHGLSVATTESSNGDEKLESPYIAKWLDLAVDWIQSKLEKEKIKKAM